MAMLQQQNNEMTIRKKMMNNKRSTLMPLELEEEKRVSWS